MRLSDSTLARLSGGVATPGYDRSGIRTGIVHLGLGAFHRAHQAVATDDCLAAGACNWGIAAASLRSPDTRDALAPQDGLYTLALRQNEEIRLRVIGALRKVLVAPEDPGALLSVMVDPAVRIVSLTITEKGYAADLATGNLRLDDPAVQHDLLNPESPRTALGFIIEALRARRAAGVAPFTILSCDNLPRNGHLTHQLLTQFAEARDPTLARYVAEEVACPSTMVDRIVPATTDADRALVAARLGAEDHWPVMAEPFFQWVIEDRFPTGRPDWESAGAQFTTDVAPFEEMKLRLLNGAHTTIAAIGRLTGRATVAEAMADPVIRALVRAYWTQVAPTLAPGLDVPAYTARLLERFDNRALQHKTAQIATDASLKVPQRILAPLFALMAAGRPCGLLVLAVALWIRSSLGQDETGGDLPLSDPLLQAWAARPGPGADAADIATAFAGFAPVFGNRATPALMQQLTQNLAAVQTHGPITATRLALAQAAEGQAT